MKKPINNTATGRQVKKSNSEATQLILNKVNQHIDDKFLDENLDNYNQKESILDMVNKMPYRKFISKKIRTYRKRYRTAYYDEMFRLTGFKRDKENPHYKPHIFAKHTLEIVYRNFPDGIISYFNENNKADINGHRLYKHFQLLNQLGETKLALIIEDAIRIMKLGKNWSHFLRLWGQHCKTTYQTTMFEDE